jgi:uncharacterized protein with GYD domain
MATFVTLGTFSDQGIRDARNTVKRADMVKEAAAKAGIQMKEILWTLGAFDFVVTFEAPDDASMTAFALSVGAAGNVRTQTMRAFNRDEMTAIIARMG